MYKYEALAYNSSDIVFFGIRSDTWCIDSLKIPPTVDLIHLQIKIVPRHHLLPLLKFSTCTSGGDELKRVSRARARARRGGGLGGRRDASGESRVRPPFTLVSHFRCRSNRRAVAVAAATAKPFQQFQHACHTVVMLMVGKIRGIQRTSNVKSTRGHRMHRRTDVKFCGFSRP